MIRFCYATRVNADLRRIFWRVRSIDQSAGLWPPRGESFDLGERDDNRLTIRVLENNDRVIERFRDISEPLSRGD